MPVPPADGTLGHRPATRLTQGLSHVFRLDVLAVYVVEGSVVGLGYNRQAPVLVFVGARLEFGGYQGIAHHADAVGVGDCDWRGEHAGLPDPLQAGHLAVAVETVAAREDRVVPGETLPGTDDGHVCPDRSLPDDERALPPHDGGVPDAPPPTSVIALFGPSGRCPTNIPASRARLFSIVAS